MPGPGKGFNGDPDEFRLTLIEHLEELRTRIIRVLAALVVGWFVGWYLEPPLYFMMEGRINDAILRVLGPKHIPYTTAVHNATEFFMLKLKLSFYIGLVLTLPVIILNIWGFVAPALKPNEQRPFKRLAPASTILFLMGAGFAYAAVPAMFAWFASYAEDFHGVSLIQEAGSQLFLVVKMMLAFGVAFQLPLIVYGLGLAGVLTADTLVKYWRHGASGIFLIAAVVTPSNDPFSMLMMAIPLTALFIGSVYAVKFMERGREKQRLIDEEARQRDLDQSPIAVLDRPDTPFIIEQNGADLPDPLEETGRRLSDEGEDGTDELNRTSG